MTVEAFEPYGLEEMTDDEIADFLASQTVGVLALPTEGAPLVRPMSFDFSPPDEVHISYVLAGESQKRAHTNGAARLLVYTANSPFNWRSVIVTGSLERVPDAERQGVIEDLDIAWRPSVFEGEELPGTIAIYRLRIDERSGIKQVGLPPGLEP